MHAGYACHPTVFACMLLFVHYTLLCIHVYYVPDPRVLLEKFIHGAPVLLLCLLGFLSRARHIELEIVRLLDRNAHYHGNLQAVVCACVRACMRACVWLG